MPKPLADIRQFREALGHTGLRVERVSDWSVGMHIQHCGLVMVGICRALSQAELPPPKAGFNLLRPIVLLTGRVPRGRAQSPEEVVPSSDMSDKDLGRLIQLAERMMEKGRGLDPGAWYRHFAFGILKRDAALRVLEVHNRHHLRIIRDIRAAGNKEKP
jgi:hypothetical protein